MHLDTLMSCLSVTELSSMRYNWRLINDKNGNITDKHIAKSFKYVIININTIFERLRDAEDRIG